MSDKPDAAAAGGLVRLTPHCSVKLLEEPAVYNRATDELYYINAEAAAYLARCASGAAIPADDEGRAFVAYCLEESILERSDVRLERLMRLQKSPRPSLRYLLLHVTDRCNLACRHCFLGEAGAAELGIAEITAVVDEFEALQGLRLMVSGGEPLLHPRFREINSLVADRDLRTILLTNGSLLDEETVAGLGFNEVQVSIDGIGASHDRIRGDGAFARTLAGARRVAAAGLQLSVATMIHNYNLDEFDRMAELVRELGAREWSIDMPAPAGRLAANSDLLPDAAAAGPLLRLAYGGAVHEPAPGYACGAHLMAVMADGGIARCGFYGDNPVGTISDGLAVSWARVGRITLAELECDCEHVAECRGGCRFRASITGGEYGIDPCQCSRYGVA